MWAPSLSLQLPSAHVKPRRYYFNVCGDANQVPEACVSMQKAVRSPVFQVSNDNNCFWLGKLKGMDWELIDDSEPAAGVRELDL